jgi:uncharacterized protein (TIGR04255 family)
MSELKLRNPPIVEAVLDIECDFQPGQQFPDLEQGAKDRFLDRYPELRPQFLTEHKIEAKPGKEPAVSLQRHAVQAFQFLQEDKKQLVQVRANGFSFNRLAPYTSLDDYLPEIERCWSLYTELAKPVQIRLIRLHYINRILLQSSGSDIELDDFFKVAPRLPDEENLRFTGFLNHYTAVEENSGYQINIVLTSQPREGSILPVIFDNTVASTESGEPDNWVKILATIQSLRDLKNRIFRRTLTERCLELFQ